VWDAIRCPTLLLRGAHSDLLSAPTAQSMAQRGPRATLVEFEGVGHAPSLMAPDQVDAITGFLRA
jgi:pimeloyl-ACP methyl ester carboxylesterase